MRPQIGDAVDLPNGKRAVVSVNYTDTQVGICLLSDVYGGRFFFGPSVGPMAEGETEYASVSGGPHPVMSVEAFKPTGETAKVNCWQWKSLPCAGGGVEYVRTVPLWKVED